MYSIEVILYCGSSAPRKLVSIEDLGIGIQAIWYMDDAIVDHQDWYLVIAYVEQPNCTKQW